MSVDNIGGTTVILGSSDIAALFGTPLNSGGTATFAAVLGDMLNSSVAARLTALATSVAGREQAISVNAPNHIAVTVDLSSATWNTMATHEVFTVTGFVRMRLWVFCTESVLGLGGGRITIQDDNMAGWFGGAVDFSGILAGNMFAANGIVNLSNSADGFVDKFNAGSDVGYDIAVDPATDGTLIFHCVWEPLSAGATVVAGAGGPL